MATNPPNLGGVVGIDNIAPIYNLSGHLILV